MLVLDADSIGVKKTLILRQKQETSITRELSWIFTITGLVLIISSVVAYVGIQKNWTDQMANWVDKSRSRSSKSSKNSKSKPKSNSLKEEKDTVNKKETSAIKMSN